ncbi:MAG: DUF1801 domain-containing protein [Propionibacteriaceae bacterium]|nr:DUF1801 domain-containing protein [Propionibacteriaceae bacterium]
MDRFTTIDEYICQLPESQQVVLEQIRHTIHRTAPEAKERISYDMPAFWQGQTLIWFGATKKHLGIYPTGSGVEAFADRLTGYETSKGTIRIPWDKPVPVELIADIVAFRLAEVGTGQGNV